MPKKILLVDDDKLFMKNLRNRLSSVPEVLDADICFSVAEAVEHIANTPYELVITDILMPEKTGIDLLIHLKEIRFPGKVMVMSAFSNRDYRERIKRLGVVDVISKPFKVEWFKNMLLEWADKTKGRTVTFEAIDLITVLQILNLEKGTSVLQITAANERGRIFFQQGEIIHAEYRGVEGEDALFGMLSLDNNPDALSIGVKKIRYKAKQTIKLPFINLMMNMVKIIDEARRDAGSEETEKPSQIENRQVAPAIHKLLETFTTDKDSMGAWGLTRQGEKLEGISKIPDTQAEHIVLLASNTINDIQSMSKQVELGALDVVTIHMALGTILIKSCDDGKNHLYIILLITRDGNHEKARMELNKAAEELKPGV